MKEQKELLNTTDKQQLTYEHIENTPFTLLEEDGVWCGLIGNKRITNFYNDKNQCLEETTKISWNRIIQVVLTIIEKEK